MATFGHLAAGLAAGRLPARAQPRPRVVQVAFGTLALLPDLDDFIPGLRHDGPTSRTHTPAATLAGTLIATVVARRLGLSAWRSSLAALVSLGSQPVFDAMTHGKGEPIFWPISGERHLKRLPGLPTWKPEKGKEKSGIRSVLGELAWRRRSSSSPRCRYVALRSIDPTVLPAACSPLRRRCPGNPSGVSVIRRDSWRQL